MTKTKKVKSAGRYGSRAGVSVRNRLVKVESMQHKKQICPYCSKPGVKREAAGIWHCWRCDKRFAGNAYSLTMNS